MLLVRLYDTNTSDERITLKRSSVVHSLVVFTNQHQNTIRQTPSELIAFIFAGHLFYPFPNYKSVSKNMKLISQTSLSAPSPRYTIDAYNVISTYPVPVLVPTEARCTFESGFCGWQNTSEEMSLTWKLYKGDRQKFTGPKWDNTYQNRTGKRRRFQAHRNLLVFFLNKFSFFSRPQVRTPLWTCPVRRIWGRRPAWKAYTFTRRRRTVPTRSPSTTIRAT